MILLFSFALAATVGAQAPSWLVEPVHVPSSSLQRLPPAERASIEKLLRPQLGPLFQGEAASVVDQAIRSFSAERLTLGGMSAVALAASGAELCGPTGNCSFWIIDVLHRRVLLRAQSVQAYAVDRTKPHGVAAIVTATRQSPAEYERIHWQFLSGHYEAQSCATIDSSDSSGATLTQPKITAHPCAPEGN